MGKIPKHRPNIKGVITLPHIFELVNWEERLGIWQTKDKLYRLCAIDSDGLNKGEITDHLILTGQQIEEIILIYKKIKAEKTDLPKDIEKQLNEADDE